MKRWIIKLYSGGVTLEKISLALKTPISKIIEIIYNEKIYCLIVTSYFNRICTKSERL